MGDILTAIMSGPDEPVKGNGYFLIVDDMGVEYRLPERLFMAVDHTGKEVDPEAYNTMDTDMDAPTIHIELRTTTKEENGDERLTFRHYVSVSLRGVERITTLISAGFHLRDGWAIEREIDHNIVTFRRDPGTKWRNPFGRIASWIRPDYDEG